MIACVVVVVATVAVAPRIVVSSASGAVGDSPVSGALEILQTVEVHGRVNLLPGGCLCTNNMRAAAASAARRGIMRIEGSTEAHAGPQSADSAGDSLIYIYI